MNLDISAKFKSPDRYVISALRATGTRVENHLLVQRALRQMGMPLYGILTLDGYKNTTDEWLNPDAMMKSSTSPWPFPTEAFLRQRGRCRPGPSCRTKTRFRRRGPIDRFPGVDSPDGQGPISGHSQGCGRGAPACQSRHDSGESRSRATSRRFHVERRTFIKCTGLAACNLMWGLNGRLWAGGSAHRRRLVVVLLRGAVDGLSVVVPYAESEVSRPSSQHSHSTTPERPTGPLSWTIVLHCIRP